MTAPETSKSLGPENSRRAVFAALAFFTRTLLMGVIAGLRTVLPASAVKDDRGPFSGLIPPQ